MRNRTTIVFGTAVAGLLAWMLLSQGAAVGATAGTLTLPAPTMVEVASSSHNSSSCGSQVGPQAGSEGQGVIQNGDGSYLGAVNLPQGSTVTSLRLTAHDFTTPGDVFAYLVRKSAKAQSLFTAKYDVLATIKSNGAVNTARRFTTTAISDAVIDNTSYGYWVEIGQLRRDDSADRRPGGIHGTLTDRFEAGPPPRTSRPGAGLVADRIRGQGR